MLLLHFRTASSLTYSDDLKRLPAKPLQGADYMYKECFATMVPRSYLYVMVMLYMNTISYLKLPTFVQFCEHYIWQ